jgi:hypothetical protein
MPEQTPSIGRVVHVVSSNGVHVPADICAVQKNGTLDLFVKDSTLHVAHFAFGVTFDPKGKVRGSWHWPEYVPAKD